MTSEAAAKRVAITGTFDVANYGDLLFPLIARHRLGSMGVEIVPVSPTTGMTVFADAMRPVGIESLIAGEQAVDAILIGGGYIIHLLPLDVLQEYRDAGVGESGVPALWCDHGGRTAGHSHRMERSGRTTALFHSHARRCGRCGASCLELCSCS